MEKYKRVFLPSTIQKILAGKEDHFMGEYAVVPEDIHRQTNFSPEQIKSMEIFREPYGNGISVYRVKGIVEDSSPSLYKEAFIFLCAYHKETKTISCIHDEFSDPKVPNGYQVGKKQRDIQNDFLTDIFSYLIPIFFTMDGQLNMEEFKGSGATPIFPAFPVFYRGICEAILYIVQYQHYGVFDFMGDSEQVFYYMHQFGSDPGFYLSEFTEDQIISYAFCCDQQKLIAQTACDFAKKKLASSGTAFLYGRSLFQRERYLGKFNFNRERAVSKDPG